MIQLVTNDDIIPVAQLQDGDWVIADFGDEQVLMRFQDALHQGDFHPVLVNTALLQGLGFHPSEAQHEGSEVDVYALNQFRISVIHNREFVFEGGARGRIAVDYLHVLQQVWRQFSGEDLIDHFLEQPHTIESSEE